MKKIPTVFLRDNRGHAINQINPGCEVALAIGVPTRKWDGTCCLIRGGKLYKRLEWDEKKGNAPASWLHHDFDPAIRHGHGWIPVGDGPDDWMHREAFARGKDDAEDALHDGTYELVGPRVGKNPERLDRHLLVPHGRDEMVSVPRDFDGLRAWLGEVRTEGIVWWVNGEPAAKLKRRDFGIPWPVKEQTA